MLNKNKTEKPDITNGADDDFLLSAHIGGWVYILKSAIDHYLYIGSTCDLRKRFNDHNDGKVFSTRLRRPFELIYYEAYKSEKDARNREHNLKLRSRALAQLRKRIEGSLK